MKHVLILMVFLSGCASKPLTNEEQAVRILRKSDAPANCKDMGKVIASGLASLSDEGRENDLKKATYKAGGDTVTLDKRDENNTLYGTAFKCNQ